MLRLAFALVFLCGLAVLGTQGCDRSKEEKASVNATDGEPSEPLAEATQPATPREAAVATVDGEVVLTRGQLDARLEALVSRYEETGRTRPTTPEWRDMRRRLIVHEAVNRRLLDLAIRDAGIVVSDEQVRATLRERFPGLAGSDEALSRHLSRLGQSSDAFFDELRHELALRQLLAPRGSWKASEADLREAYERRPERWRAEERAYLYTILYRIPISATEAEAAGAVQRLAEDVRGIESLEAFEQLARQQPPAPGADANGRVGWAFRGRSRLLGQPNVDRAVFESDLGAVSGPVRTPLGAQVFWVAERREAGVRALDELTETLAIPIERRRFQDLRLELISELRQSHDVVYFDERWGLETSGG